MFDNSKNLAVASLNESVFFAESSGRPLPWEKIRSLSDSNETANDIAKQVNEKSGVKISYRGGIIIS